MRTRCAPERLEALLFSELGGDAALDVRRHLAGCAACTRSLERLRSDRALLSTGPRHAPERIAHLFPEIRRRIAARAELRARRASTAVFTLAAAVLAVVFARAPAAPHGWEGPAAIGVCVAELVPDSARVCDASGADDAVALLEARYGACLNLCPAELPGGGFVR